MDFGKIVRPANDITLDEWNGVIEANDFLHQVPERVGVNPFTQEKVVASGVGKAHYLENGQRVGNIVLENGVLLSTAVPRTVCDEIAKQLTAEVIEDDRS